MASHLDAGAYFIDGGRSATLIRDWQDLLRILGDKMWRMEDEGRQDELPALFGVIRRVARMKEEGGPLPKRVIYRGSSDVAFVWDSDD